MALWVYGALSQCRIHISNSISNKTVLSHTFKMSLLICLLVSYLVGWLIRGGIAGIHIPNSILDKPARPHIFKMSFHLSERYTFVDLLVGQLFGWLAVHWLVVGLLLCFFFGCSVG